MNWDRNVLQNKQIRTPIFRDPQGLSGTEVSGQRSLERDCKQSFHSLSQSALQCGIKSTQFLLREQTSTLSARYHLWLFVVDIELSPLFPPPLAKPLRESFHEVGVILKREGFKQQRNLECPNSSAKGMFELLSLFAKHAEQCRRWRKIHKIQRRRVVEWLSFLWFHGLRATVIKLLAMISLRGPFLFFSR